MAKLIEHVGLAANRLGIAPLLIVVDNDGADPAIGDLAAERAKAVGLPLCFQVEPTPGIAAARNAVFAEAFKRDIRLIAMIDDDEWPSEDWLLALDEERRRSNAVIVGGPVFPVFPRGAEQLEAIARFWSVQSQQLQGKPFVFCTCNFLIDLHAIRDHPRPLFAPEFGLSGGGDTVFFRSLFFAGYPMAWAPKALVHEEVPPSRASVAWMRTRRFRVGNHAVNWESRDQGRGRTLAKTVMLTARLAIYPFLNREPEARLAGWLFEADKVRGRWNAHRGNLHMEYARDGTTGVGTCR